jgi:hypothetical protein
MTPQRSTMSGTRPVAWPTRSALALLLAAQLAGCVAPADPVALVQARAALEQARSAPRVRALAAAELDRAEVALEHAEAAAKAGAPANRVDHLAYLASQQAALAEAHALDRVAQAEIDMLERALGPIPAGAPGNELEPARADAAPAPAPPDDDGILEELTLDLSELPFDDVGPSYETAMRLSETAARLIREPGGTVAIQADFDLPDPVARTAMERRVEMARAELLRRGIAASRIIVRASAPRDQRALSGLGDLGH